MSTSIASYTYAADVFDEELNNLLGKPVITKETLPDGSVVSTVSIGGTSADATSGFVTLPDGVKIQFTKSSSAGTTTFMNLSDGTKTVCIGKTCNGKVSVAPSFQASFSSLSQSIASNSFSSDSSNSGPVNVIVSEKVP